MGEKKKRVMGRYILSFSIPLQRRFAKLFFHKHFLFTWITSYMSTIRFLLGFNRILPFYPKNAYSNIKYFPIFLQHLNLKSTLKLIWKKNKKREGSSVWNKHQVFVDNTSLGDNAKHLPSFFSSPIFFPTMSIPGLCKKANQCFVLVKRQGNKYFCDWLITVEFVTELQ